MEAVKGFVREVVAERMVLGVEGTFFTPGGLVVFCRTEDGWMVVRREGVAAVAFVVAALSVLVFDANDILLGLADMPSLLFSSPEGFSSTELADCLF